MNNSFKLIFIVTIWLSFFQSYGQKNSISYYSTKYPHPSGSGFGYCIEKFIMTKNKDSVNLIFYKMCFAEEGEVIEQNNLIGTMINEYTITGIEENKFKIFFTKNFKLAHCEWNSQFQQNSDLYKSKAKYTFKEGLRDLKETPYLSSKTISKIDPKNSKAELIEIGKLQKINKTNEFWYKIKINNFEGWILGGLYLFVAYNENIDLNTQDDNTFWDSIAPLNSENAMNNYIYTFNNGAHVGEAYIKIEEINKVKIYEIGVYKFNLKKGEFIDHWISLPESGNFHYSVSSSLDKNYFNLIYSDGDVYNLWEINSLPEKNNPNFKIEAMEDQVITLIIEGN